MRLKKTLFIFVTIIAFVFNCNKKEKGFFTVEVIDGVRHVYNYKPQWGDEPKFTLEFARKIGVFEGPDENYMFYYPDYVAKDKNGILYIVDTGNHRIQKFDAQGNYLATIGREGEGPGEFYSPSILEFDAQGNLIVISRLGRSPSFDSQIKVLNVEGKELRRYTTIKDIGPLRLLKSGNLVMGPKYAGYPYRGETFEKKDMLIRIYNFEGNLLEAFVEPVIRSEFVNTSIVFTVDLMDNIYLTYPNRNLIEKYTAEGKLLMQIRRQLNYLEEKKSGSRTEPSMMSECIDIDKKGRIWVMTRRRQLTGDERLSLETEVDYYELEIFDKEGILLGKIPMDFYFDKFRIIDERIYFIDPTRAMCVYEYKIVEK